MHILQVNLNISSSFCDEYRYGDGTQFGGYCSWKM